MKKKLTFLVALLVLVSMGLFATGTKEAEATTATSGGVSAADAYKLPLAKSPVTFKYMVAENATQYKSKASGLPITLEIQRLTGITLDVEAIPSANYPTVLTTRLAAGVDLPDIVNLQEEVYQYGVDGIIVSLTPYIKKYDTYLEALFKAEPDVAPYFRAPDGNYYGFFPVLSGTDLSDPYGWMIRRDWLEAVGMDPPTSIDKWYEVLKAFEAADANGNGDPNDEVPWCAAGLNEHLVWGQAWGLPYRSDGWAEKDGKVYYAWITDEAKDMFTWLAKCYAENLFDPEFLTLDHRSRIARNVAGSFCRFANNLATRTQYAREGGAPNAYYMGLPAPSGPDGYSGKMDSYGPSQTSGPMSITNACKDPDLAFRFMDWVWGSEQGTTLLWFGVKGVHWTPNAAGKPNYMGEFFTNNPDGWTSHETALVSIGGHTFFPSVRGKTGYWAYFSDAKLEAATDQIAAGIKVMAPSIKTKFPPLVATPDESDQMAMYWNDIRTYASEQAVKFITGELGMDEWDEYVATINKMGLDEVIKVKQIQYDRMMEK